MTLAVWRPFPNEPGHPATRAPRLQVPALSKP